MDEMIIREMKKRSMIWIGIIFCIFIIISFTGIGVYEAFWNVPAKNTEITELTNQLDVYKARVKELDKYVGIQNKNIATQEDKYRVACKFDHLFMLIADPDQVISFEALDGYIKSRKAFFEPVKTKGE